MGALRSEPLARLVFLSVDADPKRQSSDNTMTTEEEEERSLWRSVEYADEPRRSGPLPRSRRKRTLQVIG
jgi:hypothetical protein